jgi:hypothetical protein
VNREHSKLREPTLILLLIVAFCSIYSNWLTVRKVPASDFYQFWVVGQELAGGKPGDIYSDLERERIGRDYLDRARVAYERNALQAAEQRAVLETFSTPFLYTVFGSLSSGDYARDVSTFRALSLLFIAFSVAVLCRLLGYGAVSTIAAITLFSSWFAPVRSDWFVGNVNSAQLAWLVFFLWISCRFPTPVGYVAGGLILGLGAMFKPNSAPVILLLFAAWSAGRRSQKLLLTSVGIAAGVAVAFVWSSTVFGSPNIWRNWVSALSNLPEDIITVELGNYAPVRLLSDWSQIDATLAFTLVFVGLVLVAIGRGLWGAMPGESSDRAGLEDVHVVALAGLVMLLSSPLSWLHYFVAALPMLLIVLRPTAILGSGGASWMLTRAAAFIALVAMMMWPLGVLEMGNTRSRAVFLCVGTFILFGLGLRALLALRTDFTDARDDA